MKLIFLTFANTDFMSTKRISDQARDFGVFDEIIESNETHITSYMEKHKLVFESGKTKGFGLWIWKPKIILDQLNKMNDGDILFYTDAGTFLNKNGLPRFYEYLDLIKTGPKSVLNFSTNDEYKAKYFVKIDAIFSYFPEFNDLDVNMCYAGIMFIRKCNQSVRLIEEWLELCENYHFLDRSDSILPEPVYFKGNDYDNGLFNLCVQKHQISHIIYPDEINVYTSSGKQLHHSKKVIEESDWESLNDKPIQVRRLVPKRPTKI